MRFVFVLNIFNLLLNFNGKIYGQTTIPTPQISTSGGGLAALSYPFFPIRHEGGAKLFWDQDSFELLKVNSLSANFESGTVYSELYGGFIGDIVRVGLGTTLAAVKEDTTGEIASIQRQISGGGLISLNFQYPIAAIPFNNVYGLALIASPRVGADLPAAGSATEFVTANLDIGVDLHFIFGTDDRVLMFPFDLRYGYVIGTEAYKSSNNLNENFGYFYFMGGLKYEVLKITFGGIVGGNKKIQEVLKPLLSVSIVKPITDDD